MKSMTPNPFHHALNFVLAVPRDAGKVELSVFDLAGRRGSKS